MMILETTGDKPAPRFCHSATVYESKIIIFGGSYYGGEGKIEFFGDVFIFNTDDYSWELMVGNGDAPSPRSQHTGTLIDKSLIIIGGYSSENGVAIFHDSYSLNLKKKIWKKQYCGGFGPMGFYAIGGDEVKLLAARHTATHVINDDGQDLIIVYGLCHFAEPTASLYILDTKNWIWTKVPNELPGILCHTSSPINEKEIIIFGGMDRNKKIQ